MYWHLYLWTHLRVRYLVVSWVRWFIGTLPDRPIGLYCLKHEVAHQRGLAYLSRCNSGWFCHMYAYKDFLATFILKYLSFGLHYG
jgi:hypothetical protein